MDSLRGLFHLREAPFFDLCYIPDFRNRSRYIFLLVRDCEHAICIRLPHLPHFTIRRNRINTLPSSTFTEAEIPFLASYVLPELIRTHLQLSAALNLARFYIKPPSVHPGKDCMIK